MFYFESFSQNGTFPTTDRAAGRSGADDSRKQRAESGDSEDDGAVPRPDKMASRFGGREAPSERYCVMETQVGTQCSLLLSLNTQPFRLFLSLNSPQQRRLLFYSLNTHNTAVCFFSVNTQHCRLLVSLNTQCRLLFYSLNTTLPSASFVEHNYTTMSSTSFIEHTTMRLQFFSLNTTMSSASFIEHNNVVCFFH